MSSSASSHGNSSPAALPVFVALVPAAGSGSRMGGTTPKQYLDLLGKPVIWHTLRALAAVPRLQAIHVVLSAEDDWWAQYDWSVFADRLVVHRCGGATRAESVANALPRLGAAAVDWILVHDAARACLRGEQVDTLIDALRDDEVGGLLAAPVADTMKRAQADGRVCETVPRDGLWQAQTPQMFRLELLQRALAAHSAVTDEAGAVEALGLSPKLVAADATNFKITYPQDLALAAQILRAREAFPA
ncbi:MAG: 2-C-methyl-D-erythritol 4-phosphate cytidylyltransferase [Rhodocyclaceae bacterium]